MKSARPLVAIAFLASLAGSASAQTTRGTMLFEARASASYDPDALFTGGAITARPGDYVTVRVRMLLDSPETVLGFGGCTYQPRLSNFLADLGDEFDPIAINNPPDPPIHSWRRIFPFSSVGQGSASASGLLTTFIDPGNTLRFAGANAVTPTLNLAWGVNSAQLTRSIGGTGFWAGPDPVVFQYVIRLSSTNDQPRELIADAPLRWIQNSRQTWFRNVDGTDSLLYTLTEADIIPVSIQVIPAPPAFSIAVMAAVAFTPRRSRRSE
jgi:hypothetical protein